MTTNATSPGASAPLAPVRAPQTTTPIQRLDATHADAASATLAEAFFDDPVLQIVAPDEATRRRWGPWFMGLPVQYGLRWGEVWGADDASAVAAWVPPDSGEMGFGRMLRLGPTTRKTSVKAVSPFGRLTTPFQVIMCPGILLAKTQAY
jgi:hypothetical protein